MPIEILKSVDDLRHQLEQARSSLKSTDENIKRLIGRDPSELPPRNQPLKRPLDDKNSTRGPPKIVRRNELFTNSSESRRNDNNDNSKRRNPNSVFSRLSDKVVADEPIGPAKGVTSKVIVTPKEVPSRQKALDEQSRDVKFKERNKRMFGALLGTLQKFQQEETKQKKRVDKKAQIEKKIEEHEIKEKEEIRREKQELFYNRRKKQTEIKILELKMTRMREYNQWEEKQRPRLNFIVTKAKPHIQFLPRRMDDKSKEFLEKSAAEIERAIEKKRDEVSEELKRIEERMMKSFEQKFGLHRNKDSDEHELEHETNVDQHFDLDAIVQDALKNDTHVKSQIKKIEKDNNGEPDSSIEKMEALKEKRKEPKEKVIEGNEKENEKKSWGKSDERHEKAKSRRSRSLFKDSPKKRSLKNIDGNNRTTSKSERSPRKAEEKESNKKLTKSVSKSPEKSKKMQDKNSPEKQPNANENIRIKSRSRSKSNEKLGSTIGKDDKEIPTRSHSKSVDRQSDKNKQEISRSNSPRTPSKNETNKSLKSRSKSPERQSKKSTDAENETVDPKAIHNRSKSRSKSKTPEKISRKTKKSETTRKSRRSSSSSSSERETKKSKESDKKKSKSASASPERKSRKTKLNTKTRFKKHSPSSSDLSSSSSDSDSSPERKSKKDKENKKKMSPKERSRKEKDDKSKNRSRHSSDDSESDSSVNSRSSSSSSYSSASSKERKPTKDKGKNEYDSSKGGVNSPRRKTSIDRDLILSNEIKSSDKDNESLELNHQSSEIITNKDDDIQDIYSDLHDNEEIDSHQANIQSEPTRQSNLNIHFSQNNYQYNKNEQQREIPVNQHQMDYPEPMSQDYQEPSYENNAPPIDYQNNINMQQQVYQNRPMDYQNSGNHLFISNEPQFQNDPNVSTSYSNNSNFQPPIMSAPSMQQPPPQFSSDPNMAHPPPSFPTNLNQQFQNNPPHFQNNTGPHFPPPTHQNAFSNPPPNFNMPPMPPNFGPPQNMPPPQSNIPVPVSFPNESMGYPNNPQFPPPNQPYTSQEFNSSAELSEPGFPPVQRNFQNPPPIRMQFRHATPPKQSYHNTQNLVSLTQSLQRPPFGPRGRGRGNMFSGGT